VKTRQEFFPKIRGATTRIALHPGATRCNTLPSFFHSPSTPENWMYHVHDDE